MAFNAILAATTTFVFWVTFEFTLENLPKEEESDYEDLPPYDG